MYNCQSICVNTGLETSSVENVASTCMSTRTYGRQLSEMNWSACEGHNNMNRYAVVALKGSGRFTEKADQYIGREAPEVR